MIVNSDAFHYPPELFDLLIQTIPVLCRSKKDLLLFFRGAGIPDSLLSDVRDQINIDKTSITKYDIVRTILTRINEKTDDYLPQRRELLKRISEFETFSNCWPNEQFAARGYVAEVKKIIQTKDAFTRMEIEREKELSKHRKLQQDKIRQIAEKNENVDRVKKQLYTLFSMTNRQERGKRLEGVLNDFFKINDILVREAFALSGSNNEGIIEQIDGVIEIDSQVYFVEMKWLSDPVSNKEIYQHLGRIFGRPRPNGVVISASGYTDSAIIACKDALTRNGTVVLMDLEEIVKVLESGTDFSAYLREKIMSALIDKNPYFFPR